MPDKPSRRQRRRVSERTGQRPQSPPLEAPRPPVTSPAPAPPPTPGPPEPPPPPATTLSTPTPPRSQARPASLAPSAARAAAYLQERQRQILRELRGLAVTWAIVLGLFAAIVTLLSVL